MESLFIFVTIVVYGSLLGMRLLGPMIGSSSTILGLCGLYLSLFWLIAGFQITELPRGPRVFLGLYMSVGVALALFRVRSLNLRVYAILEIAFALAGTGHILYTMKDEGPTDSEILGAMAGAYVLIRGIDNFTRDLEVRRDSWKRYEMQMRETRKKVAIRARGRKATESST
jgi:hypothetical protein